ncbi:MAG: RidA family protein [Myxococcota bacterium]|nr:RidA family protein [Myxococcota bacterium]
MDRDQVVVPAGMEGFYDQFHFAPAVRDGDRLFCSGQTGTGAGGKVDPDPAAQFRQAFENVRSVLEAAGVGFGDVVEMTTFHVGFNEHIAAFMAAKDAFVSEPYPAWTAIGVSELAFGALVEIKVTARLPG